MGKFKPTKQTVGGLILSIVTALLFADQMWDPANNWVDPGVLGQIAQAIALITGVTLTVNGIRNAGK